MPVDEKVAKCFRGNLWRGLIYAIEAVSDLFGVCRLAPYRYLREYSVARGAHLEVPGAIPLFVTYPAAAREMEGPSHGLAYGLAGGASLVRALSRFAGSSRPERGGGFGSLGRRRRRVGAVVLAALLAVLLLAFALPALLGGGGGPASSGGGDSAQGSEPEARDEDESGAEERAARAGTDGNGRDARKAAGPAGAVADSGTRVPDVSGSSVEQAKRALNGAGLKVGATRSVASREVPEGSAAGTQPSGGSFVEGETRITLLVSGGPDGPTGASAGSSASASPASASPTDVSSAPAAASASPAASAQPR